MITTGIDCLVSRFGTGMESCQAVEGLPVGFYLVPVGWSLNRTPDTFNSAYVDTQIQLGNFIPFTGTFEMTAATPDATTQESQSGITSVVRQGKTVFTAIFKKGIAFQNAAYSYNSDFQYDVLIVYATGYVKGVVSPDGTTFKALSMGMLNTNGYTENTGSASAQTTMMFQLTDPLEYNQYAYLLTNLDFNPAQKVGVTNLLFATPALTFVADASDAKASFPIVWRGNEQFTVAGFTAATLQFTQNNVVITPLSVTYNTATKKVDAIFTAAVLVAGQALTVVAYDSINSRNNAKIGTKFYQGVATTTVVA